jgi:hypothetical protein
MQKVHGKEELQSLVKLRIKLFIIVGCADRKKHSFVFCSWFKNLKPPCAAFLLNIIEWEILVKSRRLGFTCFYAALLKVLERLHYDLCI